MSPQTPALRNTAIALALSILCCAQAPMPEPVTDQETELGDQMYKELKAKGEIVASSPRIEIDRQAGAKQFVTVEDTTATAY